MKKICIVLALFTMFMFIGCGSDKDGNDTATDTDSVTDTDSAADSGDSQAEVPDSSDSGETEDNEEQSDDTEITDNTEHSDDADPADDTEIPDNSEGGDEIQDEDESQNDGENDEDEVQDEDETPNDEDSDEDADSANDEDQIVANPCEGVSCGNGGVCSVENGSAVCNCPHGYYGNGNACTAITSQQPGWIGVQWPFTISASVGDSDFSTLEVFGRIYVEGTTGCPFDAHPQQNSWIAQLGYKKGSGSAEYPITAGTWTWINADFNPNYTCFDGDIKYDNHEYMASFPTNEAGNFIYIFRFSLDNGATWWYGDKGIGENMEPGPGFITSGTNYPGKATIN